MGIPYTITNTRTNTGFGIKVVGVSSLICFKFRRYTISISVLLCDNLVSHQELQALVWVRGVVYVVVMAVVLLVALQKVLVCWFWLW